MMEDMKSHGCTNERTSRAGWYEGGRRKAKAFPTKALTEHFRYIEYTQLNSKVFMSIVDFDWNQMIEAYHRCKQVEGLVEASVYEIQLTLRDFSRIVGLSSSKGITQQALDAFVLKRSEEVEANTLNKDIRNVHAFLSWAVKNRFVPLDLEIKKVRVPQKPVASLSLPTGS